MKTIGIIGAMPSELVDIRLGLPDSEIQKKAGFDYYINQVGDTRIVHVCSGIAKVNAAVCTQALIDNFSTGRCHQCRHCRRHEQRHSRL